MKDDSIYVVMPAYNEEENIETVVRAWYPVLQGKAETSRMVIADSGSVDSTREILVKLQKELPQLEILKDTEKQHGPKLIALYKYGLYSSIGNGSLYKIELKHVEPTNSTIINKVTSGFESFILFSFIPFINNSWSVRSFFSSLPFFSYIFKTVLL